MLFLTLILLSFLFSMKTLAFESNQMKQCIGKRLEKLHSPLCNRLDVSSGPACDSKGFFPTGIECAGDRCEFYCTDRYFSNNFIIHVVFLIYIIQKFHIINLQFHKFTVCKFMISLENFSQRCHCVDPSSKQHLSDYSFPLSARDSTSCRTNYK